MSWNLKTDQVISMKINFKFKCTISIKYTLVLEDLAHTPKKYKILNNYYIDYMLNILDILG